MSENPCTEKTSNRRQFLRTGSILATAVAAVASAPVNPANAAEGSIFPKGFAWGAATAAHQVEGNNINSDLWVLEHLKPSMFAEPSGDACDHYHRYAEDIKLLAGLGLNTYRFGIEWSRIEPEEGCFSTAELEHYRRMLGACHEHNLKAMVTFSHFTVPRWFAAMGGWEEPRSTDLFVRFAERAARHLGDQIDFATTFNEPDVPSLISWMNMDMHLVDTAPMMKKAAQAIGSDRFGSFLFGDRDKLAQHMIAAHHKGRDAMKGGPGRYPVGVNLAISDDQAVGPNSGRDRKRKEVYGAWLEAASKSDFVGVQTYTRARVGKDKDLAPEPGVELTQTGWEFWPEALEQTIRYAAAQAKVPVYVTENGIATDDDTRRVEYIQRALKGVENCLHDKVDVRGYIHWSLLDNFEWVSGFKPKFGLVAVNRETQERTVKPSARYLGEFARANG